MDEDTIRNYIVNKQMFREMQRNGTYDLPTFGEFTKWNIHCFAELNAEGRIWLTELCKRGEQYDSFYFNKNKQICLVNPL